MKAPTLDPQDIAYGIPIGLEGIPPLGGRPAVGTPRAALRAVMLRALQRPPCLVSFSGGRDSSALLSVATQVAREEGLPLPVPATLVFPGSKEANEDEWQTMVLKHLGIVEWVRLEFCDELDAVGPVATVALRRHGLLWPFNAHFHLPIIEQAAGGAVVTGFGGDEIARSSETARAEQVLARRARGHPRDLLVVGLAVSPRSVRAVVQKRRSRAEVAQLPWLTPAGRRAISRALGSSTARMPLGWESLLRRWIWRDRYFRVCVASFAAMGAFHDVEVFHPFVEEGVLDALGHAGGFPGLGTRTDLMGLLFGDLLPDQVIRRASKGQFTDPLWTPTSRQFAREWSGNGVDPDLVDTRTRFGDIGPPMNATSSPPPCSSRHGSMTRAEVRARLTHRS